MSCIANSLIISKLKDKVITEIINDETLFYAINSPDIKSFEDSDSLVGTHLFRYHQNPITLDKAITFLTFQVHTFEMHGTDNIWTLAKLEIWIISHEQCMKVNNIPKITDSRNDYISKLLDLKFNGRTIIGDSPNNENNLHLYGRLGLTKNVEGALSKDYLYRQMIFETKAINDSLCDRE